MREARRGVGTSGREDHGMSLGGHEMTILVTTEKEQKDCSGRGSILHFCDLISFTCCYSSHECLSSRNSFRKSSRNHRFGDRT
jgi:hypothetical protein